MTSHSRSRPARASLTVRRRLGAIGAHLTGAQVVASAAPSLLPPPHGQVGPKVANNNVIVFFTDQQRFDTSSLHGNPMNLTPNFDRMARKGTHIAEAVTCQPVCGPARSAFQTGLWPTTSGCFRNNIGLPDDCPKIAELFSSAGYNTAVSVGFSRAASVALSQLIPRALASCRGDNSLTTVHSRPSVLLRAVHWKVRAGHPTRTRLHVMHCGASHLHVLAASWACQ